MDYLEDIMTKGSEHWFRCVLCKTFWGAPDGDGIVHRPVMTPCNHFLGEKCIKPIMAADSANSNSPSCPVPECGRVLVHQGCGHTIRPARIPLEDIDARTMIARIDTLLPLEEWEMPMDCFSCAAKKLRFRSIYSDLEKSLKNFLIRQAWVNRGVEKRGLPQGLLDEVNEDIRKCRAQMEEIKSSVDEEWHNFVLRRMDW